MTLVLRYAVRSDVGLLREGNEDSAYAGPRLLAVADGMGGHAAGEVASSLTISAMAKLDSEPPGGDMLAELSSAVAGANARLQEMIIANPAVEGMGTTLTALFWSDGHAAVCHIGDSRGYLLREGELYQITHDHTLVQSLVDEGRISVEDVSSHPQRSLLLRALDGRSIAEPDLSVHDSQVGDRYLLCSDGLSGVVSDEMLRETMATLDEPDAVTRQLIDLALRGGGPDNITCIVADVVDTASSRLPPTGTPIMAGAAANASDPRLSTDGTAPGSAGGAFDGFDEPLDGHFTGVYDQHGRPPMTAPQPILTVDDLDPLDPALALAVASENGSDLTAVRAAGSRGGHRGQPKRGRRAGRRRWPIVITSLVVLLIIIVGGGYGAWWWSQGQYYVGADSHGQVIIYRGVNERIAGISLSHPYEPTGIELAQVPTTFQQTLTATDAASSLPDARKIVANVRSAVSDCSKQYTALKNWVKLENAYQAQLVQFNKNKKSSAKDKPKPPPASPGQASQTCPAPAAFRIPASALTPAPAGSS